MLMSLFRGDSILKVEFILYYLIISCKLRVQYTPNLIPYALCLKPYASKINSLLIHGIRLRALFQRKSFQ